MFYNIERLHGSINLASFVYILAAAVALPIVWIPWLHRAPLRWLLAPAVPVVLLMKVWLGYRIGGLYLPITITELCSVGMTILLAHQIGRCLEEFRRAAVSTLVVHLHDRSRPFDEGQKEMYREIRRARTFHRPLALLSVSANDESVSQSLDRFSREAQRDMLKNYVHARIADLLTTNTTDCDIITHKNGHFVTVLPETDRETAGKLIQELKSAAKERLGLDLNIGASIFPEEEITFVKLLESAEVRMRNGVESDREPKNGHLGNGNGRPRSAPASDQEQSSDNHLENVPR